MTALRYSSRRTTPSKISQQDSSVLCLIWIQITGNKIYTRPGAHDGLLQSVSQFETLQTAARQPETSTFGVSETWLECADTDRVRRSEKHSGTMERAGRMQTRQKWREAHTSLRIQKSASARGKGPRPRGITMCSPTTRPCLDDNAPQSPPSSTARYPWYSACPALGRGPSGCADGCGERSDAKYVPAW